jgi:hypothetical protein
MTIALQQQATPSGSNTAATSITSNAFSSAAAIGSGIEVWVVSSTGVTISSVVDSAGQTYTQACLQVDSTDTTLLAGYYFPSNAFNTALTVTVTYSGSVTARSILLREISGSNGLSPITANAPVRIVTPGAGTDAISISLSSGVVTTGLISGVLGATAGTSSAVAGTGFTSAAGFTLNLNGPITETKRFTSAGTNNLTFTDAAHGAASTYLGAGMLWQELASVAPPSSGGIFVCP